MLRVPIFIHFSQSKGNKLGYYFQSSNVNKALLFHVERLEDESLFLGKR